MEQINNYYNQEYDYAKDLEINWPRLNRWLEWIDGYGGKMLDVGCGVGNTAEWAARHSIAWRGVDVSRTAIDIAWRHKRHAVCCNAEELWFKDNIFDLTTALGSIEHMDRPLKALQEMYRVLKPGGRAVILVPNKIPLPFYHGTEQPQELMLSKKEWTCTVAAAGFEICRTRKDYGPPIFKNWKPLKIIQRALLKLSYILPDSFAYAWIFDCIKEA